MLILTIRAKIIFFGLGIEANKARTDIQGTEGEKRGLGVDWSEEACCTRDFM